ncbi:MKI67 FHA domain-interacting nucleolar phosphoprotein [Pelomyxa schiedti]|nr:MKI67 FHA domain-interacting nucleolar phosphoprotein [Pelomyxa schiedti]
MSERGAKLRRRYHDTSAPDAELRISKKQAPKYVGGYMRPVDRPSGTRPQQRRTQREAPQKDGIIMLTNLPTGMEEEELRQYFSQFGEVIGVRMPRSRLTSKPRHYAFVRFKLRPVAEIAAQAIDDYMMMGKVIKCKCLTSKGSDPSETQSARDLFELNAFTKPNVVPLIVSKRSNAENQFLLKYRAIVTSSESAQAAVNKERQKLHATMKKLKRLGIDYNFSLISTQPPNFTPKPATLHFTSAAQQQEPNNQSTTSTTTTTPDKEPDSN